MQNVAGARRLEDPRLGPVDPATFVPEPQMLWPLAAGVGLLVAQAARRRRRDARADRLDAGEPAGERVSARHPKLEEGLAR